MKTTLAVILGYVVMAGIVFGGLTVAYDSMGTDKSFEPNSYAPTMTWILTMFGVGLVAAVVGGLVAAKIGGSSGTKVLTLIVVVLGVGMAVAHAVMDPPAERPNQRPVELDGTQAREWSESPLWVNLAHPVIGAIGICIGAAFAGKKKG